MQSGVAGRRELQLPAGAAEQDSEPRAGAGPLICRCVGGSQLALGADPLGAELALECDPERCQLQVVVVGAKVEAGRRQVQVHRGEARPRGEVDAGSSVKDACVLQKPQPHEPAKPCVGDRSSQPESVGDLPRAGHALPADPAEDLAVAGREAEASNRRCASHGIAPFSR